MKAVASLPPVVAVTMGDPAGVGVEIFLRWWREECRKEGECPRPLWIGDSGLLIREGETRGWVPKCQTVSNPWEAVELDRDTLAVWPLSAPINLNRWRYGQPDVAHAHLVVESIETAVRLALAGQVAAMTTLPIAKHVLHRAGYREPGHTEMLGRLTGVKSPVMMLLGKGLRVVPATIHCPLREVPQRLTQELLYQVLQTTIQSLREDFGIDNPLVGVTGLNPHAGEEGSFGHEEAEVISPVCQALGVSGPLAADSLFAPRLRAAFDAIVAMYHDQALIPLKMLAFGEAVNATLGLPFVRTSVDHGTAFDIAGRGVAEIESFSQAFHLAWELANNRAKRRTGSD
ncbi:MAG: 4-hydroxythreonine-4-phosphate dehydrogenase PdxA [Magnetococcales bacterium]|nr:4-hydroxythreonine-4-phosphate dehydrogenase PdxA [Magnetococcales bacterium]